MYTLLRYDIIINDHYFPFYYNDNSSYSIKLLFTSEDHQ